MLVAESIERSRETIVEEALGSIELTYGKLINDLAASDNALILEKDQDANLQEPLGKPLYNMPLVFTEEGREQLEIPIGKRMKGFKARVSRMEQKLSQLWQEWEAIQNQIHVFGEEVLGLTAVDGGGSFKEENERIFHLITTERANLGEEITSMCNEAIQKMKDNEQVLSATLEGGSGADIASGTDDCYEEAATGCSRTTQGARGGHLEATRLTIFAAGYPIAFPCLNWRLRSPPSENNVFAVIYTL